MNITKRTLCVGIAAATLATLAALPAGAASPNDPKTRLEGTWNITLTAGDFVYTARSSYAPGRNTNGTEGSVTTTSELDFAPDYPCATTQGAWVKTGPRSYADTQYAYCFDGAPGSYHAQLKLVDEITLSDDGNSFTGRTKVEFRIDGELEFSDIEDLSGTRLGVESID